MTDSDPKVADEVPWSDDITEYDNRHDETYLGLLDADEAGEMARTILGIDPAREPERARKAVDSHLARTRWMTKVGYALISSETPIRGREGCTTRRNSLLLCAIRRIRRGICHHHVVTGSIQPPRPRLAFYVLVIQFRCFPGRASHFTDLPI